ncbi:sushi domain-containing protein 5 [Nematolebias whitei]|uniref:sushi domain-containing protein 5 n=1 Tax=Nematolebias whitei TaxID=451745 RepID=UPI0018989BB5|nr:sushi domain-containing protein 5 [Nematolebias whitei]
MGRVFVLGLRNLSGVLGFRDAQQGCVSQHARLASVEELRHAVAQCFFSQCVRGWLHGGTVGSTVCNLQGSSLKAVNVRTENGTEDTAHLNAFCIKDKAVACGDPPSFPNARLQEHSGFEMGDELLYTCLPGFVMPHGHAAFSLLCDSCGEWYGAVQICVKDKTESHVDYEDKFEDSPEEAHHDRDSQEEHHDKVSEEVFGGASQDGEISLQQQMTRFRLNVGDEQGQQKEHDMGATVINNRRAFEGQSDKNEEQVHPRWEQERSEVIRTDADEATEEPVSLLSQKHLFWFPSEAFQDEKLPLSPGSVTQTKQRASGAQSQESNENESQERHNISHPTDVDDHDDEQDRYDNLDNDDGSDHDDSRHDDHNDRDDHDDHDDHEDDLTDDPDDPDSHQEEDDHVTHRGEHEDRRDRNKDYDNHNDDDDKHEKDHDHIHYGPQEYGNQDDLYDEQHSHEDHDDTTDDHSDDDNEHPDGSEEHPDHDDLDDRDRIHDDGDDDDDDDHLPDHDIHDDHEDKYDKSHENHDSHEDDDDDDGHSRVIFSVATERRPNITQRGAGSKTTKDETWLDGYPVQGTENGESMKKPIKPVDGERAVETTDRPNDVDVRRRIPHTNSPGKRESPTRAPELDQGVVEKVRPGFRTPGTSPDHLQPSDSPSYSDTLDYDTQQAAPTHSWLDELTEHPFLDHGLAPPVHDGDIFTGVIGERNVHNLPGEMGEMEGEMGETICIDDNCPPHPPSSSSRGPTVAAIAVLVCVVAMAVIFGVWCYKRQQQKSSVYEMNEKGQSPTSQGQQMEMQQKV